MVEEVNVQHASFHKGCVMTLVTDFHVPEGGFEQHGFPLDPNSPTTHHWTPLPTLIGGRPAQEFYDEYLPHATHIQLKSNVAVITCEELALNHLKLAEKLPACRKTPCLPQRCREICHCYPFKLRSVNRIWIFCFMFGDSTD